jgi:glycosyltransferase involved in cell wall biosynthesis
MLLSIIIPAYNVAGYIERCIRSLQKQDLAKEQYEIIITNDGSPDAVKEIVENLQREFSNIVLINQENQGVSMARNNAIAVAKGKYLMPIDPDDYIAENCFKNVLERAEKDSLDVLYCGFEILDSSNQITWRTDYAKREVNIYTGVDAYFAARGIGVRDPDRSVAILFNNQLVQQFQIDYPKDVPYLEDGLFLGKALAVAKRVGFLKHEFYKRTTRPGSATNSDLFHKKISSLGFLHAIKNLEVFRNKYKGASLSNALMNHLHAKFLLHALAPSATTFDRKTYKTIVSQIKSDHLLLKSKVGLSKVFNHLITIYNFSPWMFLIYYPAYIKFRNVKGKKINKAFTNE